MRIHSRALAFASAVLAIALSACAPHERPAPEPARERPPASGSRMDSESLPPPMPYEAMKAIERSDSGKTIDIPVGGTFVVQLVGVPTAGYLWKPVDPPDFIAPGPVTGGPTTKAQMQPGFTGGNHWEVFSFKVKGPGKAVLRLEQRRPWETNEPPVDVFEVTIRSK